MPIHLDYMYAFICSLKYMLKLSSVCLCACACALVSVDFMHLMHLLGHEIGLNLKCWSGDIYFIILLVQCGFCTLGSV